MKNLFKTTFIALTACATLTAPAAFAAVSNEVSVRIDTRYLETDWGVEKVYKTLERKAASACNVKSARVISARRIARDCMSDLLDDFIVDADEETLTAYHLSVTS